MGGLHCISQAVVKGAWCYYHDGHRLTLAVQDPTSIHAIQGSSSQSRRSETPLAVLKSRFANRGASEGAGCLCTYPRDHRRTVVIHFWGIILSCFQPDGLRRDLFLWTSGLFPFFEYSATSVKVRMGLLNSHLGPRFSP